MANGGGIPRNGAGRDRICAEATGLANARSISRVTAEAVA
jgi:hypothetical protein